MSERMYNFDAMFAVACIMEEIADPQMDNKPWEKMREAHGVTHLRHWIIELLAEACDAAWDRSYARYKKEYDTWRAQFPPGQILTLDQRKTSPNDPGAFDYDFVPFWLRNCVDWSGDEPRVRGSAGT